MATGLLDQLWPCPLNAFDKGDYFFCWHLAGFEECFAGGGQVEVEADMVCAAEVFGVELDLTPAG